MLRTVQRRFRDVADTIRFMPKATRRRIYLGTTVATSLATTGTYAGLQTIKLDWLVQQLQMYKLKMPVPVNQHLFELIDELATNWNGNIQNPLYLFNFIGCDVYSIGSLLLPTGAFIGVPFNFNLDRMEQLRTEDIRLLGRYKTKRTPDSPVIQKLFESLILTDQAKKYAMAHEIVLLSSSYFLIKTLNIFSWTLAWFRFTPWFNTKLRLNQRRDRLLPRLAGGILCMFGILALGLATDQILDHLYDLRAVKKTIRVLPELTDGGKEFYRKLISRNQAMYELLGEHGKDFYTESGETKKLFGTFRVSYETHLALVTCTNDGGRTKR